MKKLQKLQIEHLDKKIETFPTLTPTPRDGWIRGIRTALKMSFRQFGKRLGITAQSAQEIEVREMNGTLTLKALWNVASALEMQLVYGFIPREGSLEKMLEKQALAVARKIVLRTDTTMRLENQGVGKDRLEKQIHELAEEIKREMPRYLWD